MTDSTESKGPKYPPEVVAVWDDRPLGEQARINQERAAREAERLDTTVLPLGGKAIVETASPVMAIDDIENVSSHTLSPGESLGALFGATRTDADRFVDLDDEAYERA